MCTGSGTLTEDGARISCLALHADVVSCFPDEFSSFSFKVVFPQFLDQVIPISKLSELRVNTIT